MLKAENAKCRNTYFPLIENESRARASNSIQNCIIRQFQIRIDAVFTNDVPRNYIIKETQTRSNFQTYVIVVT